MKSEKTIGIFGIVIGLASLAVGAYGVYLDHPKDISEGISYFLVHSQPFIMFLLGCFIGYCYGRMRERSSQAAASIAPTFKSDGICADEPVRTPSGALCRNMSAVRTLPDGAIAAAVAAFDSKEPVEINRYQKWVNKSVESGDGVFVLDTYYFNGVSTGKKTGSFHLSKEWAAFMDDVRVIARMRDIAARWESSQSKALEWETL